MWFDSHCHLNLAGFDEDVTKVWSDAVAKGVTRTFVPGTDPDEWAASEVPRLQGVLTGVGLHPYTVERWPEQASARDQRLASALRALETEASGRDHVAVGECGWDKPLTKRCPQFDLEQQTQLVEAHLRLAVEVRLPIVLHVVQAHGLAIETLKRYKLPCGGVIHCFSGHAELVPIYTRMGFALGYGTQMLRADHRKAAAALRATPTERIVLETDAPFRTPPASGVPNSPAALLDVARVVASTLDCSEAVLAEVTTRNALRIYGGNDS